MRATTVVDATVWDAAVTAAANGHILQTYAWGELKSRFGWEAARLALEVPPARPAADEAEARPGASGSARAALALGAQVLFRKLGPVSLAYIPRGPWGDLGNRTLTQQLQLQLWSTIHGEARRRRAVFLKVEPFLVDDAVHRQLLADWGFRQSAQRVQPVSTIVVDLAPDLAAIGARLKPKWRYNIGLAARKGVTVRMGGSADLTAFYGLMEHTGKRDGFAIHSAEYYRQFFALLGPQAGLFLAHYQEQLLAGIAVTVLGRQAIYMYGASSDEHRNLMPNHLLQWEAMQWAKAQGCAEYDLWGIPDDAGSAGAQGVATEEGVAASPQDAAGGSALAGVYRFKSGFGGQVARTVGAWDYVYSPPLYWLYTRALPWYRGIRALRQPASAASRPPASA
jgi:lipid II:glycine glycyltransferase (peptidoglycan interpeptide bridge formation enzyme)